MTEEQHREEVIKHMVRANVINVFMAAAATGTFLVLAYNFLNGKK